MDSGTDVVDFPGSPVRQGQIFIQTFHCDRIAVSAIELELGHSAYPDLALLLDYWRIKANGRFAASRDDIEPAEIISLLPRIMLADVISWPLDFRYRLCGTAVRNLHGRELTGDSARNLRPVQFGAMIHAHYAQCVAERRPMQHAIHFESADRVLSYIRLLLPLTADGKSVNMLLTLDSSMMDQCKLRQFFAQYRMQE